MAMEDIRRHQMTTKFLPKVSFGQVSDNCGCSVDEVLKKVSEYSYQANNKLGFLGPWCSETIESIRGKQTYDNDKCSVGAEREHHATNKIQNRTEHKKINK